MKYVSVFLVIITDTNATNFILHETLRAFTVILENQETPTSSKTYLEKIQKWFKKASWKHIENKQRHENILDVSRRLDSNYSFGQLYKDMFD